MEKTDPIIRTKLHQPFTSQKLVNRPRLQTRIVEGISSNPLTLVIAPAGFGKTTLIAASLADCQIRSAWLSLDRGDNQVSQFLAYLIAALQIVDNRIGVEAAQLIAGMHQAATETILINLINDLETFHQDIVLVLDDFQYISNQEILSGVAFLIDHCPHSFHLLIGTRSDPLLPLSRLRARGQMVELRAADLRFTGEEAIEFLNDVMHLNLEPGAAAILEERTEGWVAGLQMAALSMRDRKDVNGFIQGFSGTNRYILDFLLEEIKANQPPEIQRFLLYTSILDRLTAPLCAALLADDGQTGSAQNDEWSHSGMPLLVHCTSALSYLERENLFLISLDDDRLWFRYHHLFADLLRARLQQNHPEMISALHLRASAWLEKNGFITEAMQHLFVIQEYERAADLVEQYGPAHFANDDSSIFQMADNLPVETLISRPKIGLYQAWFLILQGKIKKALPLLNALAQHLDEHNNEPNQAWMQTIVASAQAFLTPPVSNSDLSTLPEVRLLDEIPTEEPILRNAADFLYGMALGRRGALDRAEEVAIRCIQREKLLQGKSVPTLAPFLTRIYLMQGRLHASAAMCHEYLDSIKNSGVRFVYTSGSMKIDLGEVMYEWNFLEEAERNIREGLRDNEVWQNIMTDCFGLTVLVRVLLAKGDYSAALMTVEKFEKVLESHSRPREFEEDFRTLRVRIQLAGGDLAGPSHWAEQVQQSEDFMLHKERYALTLARIYLANARYENVVDLLSRMNLEMVAGSQISRQLECSLLLASAYSGLDRLPEALNLLKSCLDIAESEGHIQAFLNIGQPSRNLLAAYLRSDACDHGLFAQKVMGAFPSPGESGASSSSSTGLSEPLSERELEVLHLMALGHTNEEIAKQLIVARGTIKAHAASIYRKLDVANRTEAVSRARQMGLLP